LKHDDDRRGPRKREEVGRVERNGEKEGKNKNETSDIRRKGTGTVSQGKKKKPTKHPS